MIFQTKINDILCYCRVDHYSPGRPDRFMFTAMEDAEEGFDEDFQYTILDHRYIIAPWLTKQLRIDDYDRLLEEYHTTVLELKHYVGEPA
jgi:hypothetical protein